MQPLHPKIVPTYPAFRTAPVQLNEAAAVPVAFALYGEAITLSPSSSSDTAVVRLMRSSSEICGKERKSGVESLLVQKRRHSEFDRGGIQIGTENSCSIHKIYVCRGIGVI